MMDVKHLEATKPSNDNKKPKKVSKDRILSSPDVWEKYICPCCDHLLDEAVQSACGHRLCRSCAIDIFSRYIIVA